MNLRPTILISYRKLTDGFTMVELMIAIAISVIVIAAVVTLSIVTAQNFVATSNYVQMNDQGRNALDKIGREIRNSTAVVSFQTNNPQQLVLTNVTFGTGVTITCNTNSTVGTLVLSKTGQPDLTLLTGCDSFNFQLFDRYPNFVTNNILTNSIYFCASTNAATGKVDARFCKVNNMSWKCSRKILGSKLNTEIVQTAQVVLRNQVSQ
jgi:prepilin-type N-terminal cleavage/methylation domain-containing protein